MIKIRKANKRNWKSGIVHSADPIWENWEDIPEVARNPYADVQNYHEALCGADKGGDTFTMTHKKISCGRCIKILFG